MFENLTNNNTYVNIKHVYSKGEFSMEKTKRDIFGYEALIAEFEDNLGIGELKTR